MRGGSSQRRPHRRRSARPRWAQASAAAPPHRRRERQRATWSNSTFLSKWCRLDCCHGAVPTRGIVQSGRGGGVATGNSRYLSRRSRALLMGPKRRHLTPCAGEIAARPPSWWVWLLSSGGETVGSRCCSDLDMWGWLEIPTHSPRFHFTKYTLISATRTEYAVDIQGDKRCIATTARTITASERMELQDLSCGSM